MQAAFYTQVEKTDRKIGLIVSSINACIRQKDKKSFKALKELGDGVRGVGGETQGRSEGVVSIQIFLIHLSLFYKKRLLAL